MALSDIYQFNRLDEDELLGRSHIHIRMETIGRRTQTLTNGLPNGMLSELQKQFACGGHVKGDIIYLHGDHRYRLKRYLIHRGYTEHQLHIHGH